MAEFPFRYTVVDLPELGGCGGVAFVYVSERKPQLYDQVLPENIEWPDGSKAQEWDLMRCGTCGRPLQWEEFGKMTAFIVGGGVGASQ